MDWLEMPHELRRAMRVRSKGWVRIDCDHRAIAGRMVDLAIGGMCMHSDAPIAPTGLIGDVVDLDLLFDACASKHFAVRGRVLRICTRTRRVAIEFDAVPDDFEDRVQDELLAAVEHDVLPRMLLVDAVGGRRSKIAGAFRNAGCHVTEAATPLEVIAYLERSRFALGLIAIADTVPETVAEQLRDFLLDQHPGTHMVAIGTSAAHRDPAGSWLCSSNTSGDLQTRVGRVMTAHGSRRRSTMASCARAH